MQQLSQIAAKSTYASSRFFLTTTGLGCKRRSTSVGLHLLSMYTSLWLSNMRYARYLTATYSGLPSKALAILLYKLTLHTRIKTYNQNDFLWALASLYLCLGQGTIVACSLNRSVNRACGQLTFVRNAGSLKHLDTMPNTCKCSEHQHPSPSSPLLIRSSILFLISRKSGWNIRDSCWTTSITSCNISRSLG